MLNLLWPGLQERADGVRSYKKDSAARREASCSVSVKFFRVGRPIAANRPDC
jgi:hypothetical protein